MPAFKALLVAEEFKVLRQPKYRSQGSVGQLDTIHKHHMRGKRG